jgi:crotonobetainyl-CoA:carnitine CoA-transferase CaiB-like acyl-CoA transferase
MSRPGPLAGLKVLDLSRLLPGPWATLVLADLGADVVKVEEPGGGDYLRWFPPLVDGTSVLFRALNRGKRSVALDLRSDEGRADFLALAARADVVVESFRPGVLARLGLGWDALHALNPALCLLSITGFGQTGPASQRAGHDIGYLALSGLLNVSGGPGAPAPPHAQLADIAGGGLVGLTGLLAALVERSRTGLGRWVDASMTEGVMAPLHMLLAPMLADAGPAPARGVGLLSGERPCYGVYETQDGRHLALGALEPKFWETFCRAVGRDELASDGLAEGEVGARVRSQVAEIIREHPLARWTALFARHDACVEPVLTPQELPAHPVHAARGVFFVAADGPAQRTPVRFADGESSPAAAPAPALGADRAAVLAEWLR